MTNATISGRRNDGESQAVAGQFLAELFGTQPDQLLWDDDHHLQGHAFVGGQELVVIAGRDDLHSTLVLTVADWNTVRRAPADAKRQLLEECVITDHHALIARLAA